MATVSPLQSEPRTVLYGVAWRFDGNKLQAYELIEGDYQARESSLCFPRLPLEKVEELARQVGQVRELTLIRGFRQWVREKFVDERT